MRTLVYKFSAKPPHENIALARAQIRAAHAYRNDHVAIERARRLAMRALYETPEIREVEERLRSATKSDRKALRKELRAARKKCLERLMLERWRALVAMRRDPEFSALLRDPDSRRDLKASLAERLAPHSDLARIQYCASRLARDARGITSAFWGSYLGVEQSANQFRSTPLYGDNELDVSDPRFMRWRRPRYGARDAGEGQLGVQLQGGLSAAEMVAGKDTRIRLLGHGRYRELWIRAGSDRRDPVWVKASVFVHRPLPKDAVIKWARLSCRGHGPWERWSVEFTVVTSEAKAQETAVRSGTIAVECVWYDADESIRAANWRDDEGALGHVLLPASVRLLLKKSSDIRSIRDVSRNEMSKTCMRELHESKATLPPWLAEARNTMHLWKSCDRFVRLVQRWREEKFDGARVAYDQLDAWEQRDNHLYEYESGARSDALNRRKDFYRCLAKQWSLRYKTVVLEDRDYRREARFGEDSDLRFAAAPSELRECIEQAFGKYDTVVHPAREETYEEDERDFCERALDARKAGGARKVKSANRIVHEAPGGAWASRKSKRVARAS